jgi:hypothetical protein
MNKLQVVEMIKYMYEIEVKAGKIKKWKVYILKW